MQALLPSSRRIRFALSALLLSLAACGDHPGRDRRFWMRADDMTRGCDGVTCTPAGIDVHGVGVDWAKNPPVPCHLRVLRHGELAHEADAAPADGRVRFPDFHVDGITPGLAGEPGHLNDVQVLVDVGTGPNPATLTDADRR